MRRWERCRIKSGVCPRSSWNQPSKPLWPFTLRRICAKRDRLSATAEISRVHETNQYRQQRNCLQDGNKRKIRGESDGRIRRMTGAPLIEVSTLINGMLSRGTKLETAHFAKIAESAARIFSVQTDEVALLSLTADGRFLRFRVPERLQSVGEIPVTSGSALRS